MAWYNETNREGSDDEEGRQTEPGDEKKGDGFGTGGGVPPWVQAASLADTTNEPAPTPAADPAQSSAAPEPVVPPPPTPVVPDSVPPPAAPVPSPPPPVAPPPPAVPPLAPPPPAPPSSTPPPPASPVPSSIPTPVTPIRPTPRVVTHGQPVSATPPPPTAAVTAVQPAVGSVHAPSPDEQRPLKTHAPPPPPPDAQPSTGPNYVSPHPTAALDDDLEKSSPISDMTGPISSGVNRPEPEVAGPLTFDAGAWEYAGICLLSLLLFFIPIFGWAGQWLIVNRFTVEHLRVEGRPLTYTMTYGYALKLILRHLLLLICTLGLGLFWLHIKEIQAVFAHAQYADEVQS